MKRLVTGAAVLACLLAAAPASGQATRTWVSGTGDDANPCSRTAPCKTWAGAISKTAVGGEMNAMDSGPFGTLSIVKSITIDGGGYHAGMLASGVNGVSIDIPPSSADTERRVVLRGLSINGTGGSGSSGAATGLNGINLHTNGAESLEIQDTRIATFTRAGIRLEPGAAAAPDIAVTLDGVTVSDVGGNALHVLAPDTDHGIRVMVRNSLLERARGTLADPTGPTGVGVLADTGAHVWLTGTTVFDNAVGLRTNGRNGGGGVIDSFCDNQIAGNADDGTAPNMLCPQPAPAPAPAPVTVPGPTVTTTVEAPERCTVPDVRGVTVTIARRILKAANCALGTVKRKRTRKRSQVGKVVSQAVRKGTKRAAGAKVNVVVGRR